MISQVSQPIVETRTVRQFIEPTALLSILWRRKLLIVLGTIIGVAAGYGSAKFATERYESRGVLLVMQTLPRFVESGTGNVDAKNFDNLFATHIRLMHSPKIIALAIKRGSLQDLPGIAAQLDENIDAVRYIDKQLSVSRSGEGDSKGAFVIRVGFQHTHPEEAPLVVDAMMKTY